MNPTIGSALIGFGTSLAGNVVQGLWQNSRDKQAREWQERMYDRMNAYNDPSAMVQRMKAAGMNPNLLMGQPVAGAATPPSPAVGSRVPSFDDIAPNINSAVNTHMALENFELQKQHSKAETRLLNADAAEKEKMLQAKDLYGKEYGDLPPSFEGEVTRNEDGSLNLPELKVRHVKPRNPYEAQVMREMQGGDLDIKNKELQNTQQDLQNKITKYNVDVAKYGSEYAKEQSKYIVQDVERAVRLGEISETMANYQLMSMLPSLVPALFAETQIIWGTKDGKRVPVGLKDYDQALFRIQQFLGQVAQPLAGAASNFIPFLKGFKMGNTLNWSSFNPSFSF